jgi:hypothetical protein
VARDHSKNVGKWPPDASGKDPVNDYSEKNPRGVPLRDTALRHCQRSAIASAAKQSRDPSAESFWIASALRASQ